MRGRQEPSGGRRGAAQGARRKHEVLLRKGHDWHGTTLAVGDVVVQSGDVYHRSHPWTGGKPRLVAGFFYTRRKPQPAAGRKRKCLSIPSRDTPRQDALVR